MLRDWEPRFRLLFPHSTPEVAKHIDKATGHLHRRLQREADDHSIPPTIETAQTKVAESVDELRAVARLLPPDDWPIRLVVDTNTVIYDPDLGRYVVVLGPATWSMCCRSSSARSTTLSALAVYLSCGRQPVEPTAVSSHCGTTGTRVGARVAGDVFAIFEHTEPRMEGLPGWLDLSVPDDRLVASVLLLQSAHPGSAVHVATSDLNLGTNYRPSQFRSSNCPVDRAQPISGNGYRPQTLHDRVR